MATITYGLTTESRVKSNLAIDNTDLDTIIKRFIYGASDFIHRACDITKFERATYTDEKYNGSQFINSDRQDSMIIVRNAPLISVSAIKYNAGTQANPSWVTLSADDYQVDYVTGIIHFYSGLPKGIGNISITYVAGFLIDFANEFDNVLHTLPYDITGLCERLVVKALKRRESEGRSRESFNNSSIDWGDYLEDHDIAIINNYRRAFLA